APSGMASIAARVEIGLAQAAGVARSSRAGTKRKVKAGPTTRGWSRCSGMAPRIHTFRSPFFSRMVVRVAVVTPLRVSMASRSSVMGSSDALDIAAINADLAAGDIGGAFRGKERDHVGIFLRLAVAYQRDRRHALGAHFLDAAIFPLGLLRVE